ncbi:unnamed protein product [Closterium sp. Naga37s-1]|nr:unnamed protein product [Closterium sp. Naga37s-1]
MARAPPAQSHSHHISPLTMSSLLVITLLIVAPLACLAVTRPSDIEALVSFRNALKNPAPLKWPESGDPCEDSWEHLSCSRDPSSDYHVVSGMLLPQLALGGKLAPAIANLKDLRAVFLGDNGFTGPVPAELGRLEKLEKIGLDHNLFTAIPVNLFENMTNLQAVYLLSNDYQGQPMPDFSKNAALEVMELTECGFSGPLPAYIGGMASLVNLSLAHNQFAGEIPPDMFGAGQASLQSVRLNNNQIKGPIPDGLGQVPLLSELWLHGNLLSGAIPDSLGGPLSLLQSVKLYENELTGMVPKTLGDTPNLRDLQVQKNQLVGPIWRFMKQFGNKSYSPNGFCGAKPGDKCPRETMALLELLKSVQYPPVLVASWKGSSPCGAADQVSSWVGVGCSARGKVRSITLARQGLNGTLSPSLGKLLSLEMLQVPGNNLTGPVPPELAALPALKAINLANNSFTGDLPQFAPGVTVLSMGNQFTVAEPPAAPPSEPPVVPPVAPPSLPSVPKPPVVVPPVVVPPVVVPKPKVQPPVVAPKPKVPPVVVVKTSPRKPHVPRRPHVPKSPVVTPPVNTTRPTTPPKPVPPTPSTPPASVPVNVTAPPSLPSTPPPQQPIQNVSAIAGGDSVASTSSSSSSSAAPASSGGGGTSVPIAAIVVPVALLLCVALALCGLCIFFRRSRHWRRVGSPSMSDSRDPHGALASATVPISLAGATAPTDVKIRIDPAALAASRGFAVGDSSEGDLLIRIEVIRAATGDFAPSNIIGKGGFGTVYKGELEDGTKVAVKRMELGHLSTKGLSEFQAEIGVLTKLRHRHLVALLGYVVDGYERLLVYEYMPKGPLSRHLFDHQRLGLRPLDWRTRVSVALDVARGLEYLHGLARASFIHRDMKPSNVLLDDSFRAKVSDFGLVKQQQLGGIDGYQPSIETRLAGTFGYLAPEYAVTGKVTTKSDVYSYGVVLMELVTGRRALDSSQSEDTVHLATWLPPHIPDRQKLALVVDPTLAAESPTVVGGEAGSGVTVFESICAMADLALHCTARDPKRRPTMSDVVAALVPLVQQWKPQDPLEDQTGGIDMAISLADALQQWKEMGEGDELPGAYNPDDSFCADCSPSFDGLGAVAAAGACANGCCKGKKAAGEESEGSASDKAEGKLGAGAKDVGAFVSGDLDEAATLGAGSGKGGKVVLVEYGSKQPSAGEAAATAAKLGEVLNGLSAPGMTLEEQYAADGSPGRADLSVASIPTFVPGAAVVSAR